MSALLIDIAVQLSQINCGQCGGVYAITEDYREHKQKLGGFWHCPYCQSGWGFKKGTLQLREEELATEKARHQATLARLNEKEKTLANMKSRVANGVCPCCNRTFKALSQHMRNKHPEYSK